MTLDVKFESFDSFCLNVALSGMVAGSSAKSTDPFGLIVLVLPELAERGEVSERSELSQGRVLGAGRFVQNTHKPGSRVFPRRGNEPSFGRRQGDSKTFEYL